MSEAPQNTPTPPPSDFTFEQLLALILDGHKSTEAKAARALEESESNKRKIAENSQLVESLKRQASASGLNTVIPGQTRDGDVISVTIGGRPFRLDTKANKAI